MSRKYCVDDLKSLIGKKVYKDELSEIHDIRIILADASRDADMRSYGTLVFYGKEYTQSILDKVRKTKKPAIYIYNEVADIDCEKLVYAE